MHAVQYHTLYCYNMMLFFQRFLLENGADTTILTEDGERPLDLIEPSDFDTIRVMLGHSQANTNDQSDDDDTLEQTDAKASVTGWHKIWIDMIHVSAKDYLFT